VISELHETLGRLLARSRARPRGGAR
jgi:hypothetical protein